MDIQFYIPIIVPSLISGLIGGLIGIWIKSKLDKKNEEETREFERIEKQYNNMINNLLLLYREKDENSIAKIKKEFLIDFDKSWLYASDEVIKEMQIFINMMRELPESGEEAMNQVGKIVVAMRKDLGKSKTKLTFKDWNPIEHE